MCGSDNIFVTRDIWNECRNCGCVWDESKRRAQTAEAVDELLLALSVLADEYEALWSVCRSPVDQAADKAQGMDALDAARELLARARGGE